MNKLIPQIGRISRIVPETPKVKIFHVTTLTGEKPFPALPGQLAMLSLPQVGEAMFSITAQGPNHLELAIKEVGQLTTALHQVEEGQECGLRGPYGNGFPLDYCRGKDLLFIGGGIGLAPLRSMINYCVRHRGDFGKLKVVYGAPSLNELIFKEDLRQIWPQVDNLEVYLTTDRAEAGWEGHVGLIPAFIEELGLTPSTAITCGPPVMLKLVLETLERMGFSDEEIITTLERKMKCGIGKCGCCNIGGHYVCLDGPVFTLAQLKKMPQQY